jgi:PKD repeat protein
VLPTGWSQKAGVNCGNFVFDGYKVVDNNGNIVINPCHKYYWSFGDGTYGHGKTVEHKYGKNGTYKICMKVVDTCLNCDTIICNEVKVDCYKDCNWKAKYPNFTTFSIGAKCRTISAGLNTSSAGCIRQYYSIAGGAYSYDGKTYRDFTVDKNGTYVVCLKLVDTCTGCDTTICKEVKVECNPCSWTGNGFYYKVDCNKVYLEGKVTNNTCVKYVFYTGNSFIGGGRLQSYTFTKNGSYDICMKLYDTCKNCDTVICQTVKIDCQPCKAQAKFTVDSTTSGGVAYITNYSTGGAYYFWDFGDSTFSYSKNPGKHAYSASGGYTICLTVYDSAKTCSTKYCVTIKVVKTRAASISESNKLPEIKLYPNPADAYFTISVTGTGTYEVVNLQGKSISSGILNNETRVNTAGWSEGVYLVRSTLADGHVTTRMVITRQ